MSIGAIWAGLAIVAGAAAVLLWPKLPSGTLAFLLAAAGGVMTAVAALDLLPAAMQSSGLWLSGGGFLVGALALGLLERWVDDGARGEKDYGAVGLLVFFGVALHDLLEGAAVAAGYEAEAGLGWALVLAVGLHHIPEGMAMAAPLRADGVSGGKIMALALAAAVMTPIGALVGSLLLRQLAFGLGVFLAAAAGAMAYLAIFQLWPKALAQNAIAAWWGTALGVGAMGVVLL